VGWKVAARSYAAKALGGKKRVDRMVAVSREMEHSKALATTLSAEIQSGGSNLKSGAHEMHGFCWNPVQYNTHISVPSRWATIPQRFWLLTKYFSLWVEALGDPMILSTAQD